MTDDVHFGELRCSLVQSQDNLSQDRHIQDRHAHFPYVQDPNVHDRNAAVRHHAQKVMTEMLIGPWYLDEFGNPTREIKARD